LIAKYNEEQQLATDATGVRLNYTFEVVNCTEVRETLIKGCFQGNFFFDSEHYQV
jgi:hypothetical protein